MTTIEKLIRAFSGPENRTLRAEIRRVIAEDKDAEAYSPG